ncbi:hypothetical protein [Lentzea sp. NPDC055074]
MTGADGAATRVRTALRAAALSQREPQTFRVRAERAFGEATSARD